MGMLGAFVGAMAGSLSFMPNMLFGLASLGLCCVFPRKRIAIPLALGLGILFALWLYLSHDQYDEYPSPLAGIVVAARVTGVTLLGLIGMGVGHLARKYIK
jgi:hypothetical protein